MRPRALWLGKKQSEQVKFSGFSRFFLSSLVFVRFSKVFSMFFFSRVFKVFFLFFLRFF